MRLLGRLLLFILTLAVLGGAGYGLMQVISGLNVRDVPPWEESYEQSTVYMLQPGETLNFDVPNDATQLRILHTPVGLPAAEGEATLHFSAHPDETLSETYNVALRPEEAPPAGELPPRFFDAPTDTLAGLTQLHVVSFAERQRLNEFSLTLRQSAQPLAIRVAVLERYNEQAVARIWQRMSAEQKTAIFEDHIYPVELIPVAERRARLQQRWQPIGPASASDGRIVSRTLFVSEDAEALEETEAAIDELAVIGPQRWFTVDTRVQRTITAISCASLTATDPVQLSRQLTRQLTLSSVTSDGQLHVEQVLLNSNTETYTLPTTPNLYQIAANKRCELSFYDAQGDIVSADYNYLRASVVQPVQTLEFALVDEAQQVQPLRLDTRLVTNATLQQLEAPTLRWRIVDADGKQLLSGMLTPQASVNPLQVSVDASLETHVHEKTSRYIVAPANAAQLQIDYATPPTPTSGQVLVNVYTRPVDLPYQVQASDENEPQQQSIPKWFLSYPIQQQGSVPPASRLLSWQHTLPPSTAVTATATQEHWYSMESVNNAPYFELFMPEQPEEQPEASEDAAEQGPAQLIYAPIDSSDGSYQLTTPEHPQQVRPQLVYQKGTQEPVPATIYLNGELLSHDWLNADTGRLLLPALPQGDYQLKIETPAVVRWYSNYQPASAQPTYRVRNAYKLERQVTFSVEKRADEEWLTFHYFPAIGASQQVTLTLEKQEQVGVYADYTVAKRTFNLPAPETAPTTVLLNQAHAPIWAPTRLTFLLGRDLAPGRYRITVSSSASQGGYIQAGYLAEAPTYQIEIYTEDGNALF
ncbi:hypothetical protein [Pseudidiomarina insulisalsae]|uniref:Uncharacterized protein n=1 Tax=Pseudidiomarina insulisalsae TaxID=575789 RepID=A0A432YQR1_9GAMM|nr:hypothetical protein [Pseudidiomarina insulisalsae]RUO63652.1 hypothetical protein CWI71_00885 [Pseudidiomarina insulisalsae]